jgi:hypothetical protein
MSKIFERIILIRLNAFIAGHYVFLNHQFGFWAAAEVYWDDVIEREKGFEFCMARCTST